MIYLRNILLILSSTAEAKQLCITRDNANNRPLAFS